MARGGAPESEAWADPGLGLMAAGLWAPCLTSWCEEAGAARVDEVKRSATATRPGRAR